MAKRSNFKRRKQDAYHTIDPDAVEALLPHITKVDTFAEPCAGGMHLIRELEDKGLRCVIANDIDWELGRDALDIECFNGCDAIITNPPWTRPILHRMIAHFVSHKPTWLLFDSDWAYTRQAVPYLSLCSDIVAVGRLHWIEGTTMTGKDNVSWYRFAAASGPTVFHGRMA